MEMNFGDSDDEKKAFQLSIREDMTIRCSFFFFYGFTEA
jgi:hypothetical protein